MRSCEVLSSLRTRRPILFSFFFFNDTATTEIYTLSLHDALPIWRPRRRNWTPATRKRRAWCARTCRSEEHTSELQSQSNLVCRLLLEKKKKKTKVRTHYQHDTPTKSRTHLRARSALSHHD